MSDQRIFVIRVKLKIENGIFIPFADQMIFIVSSIYCPNGGANQVCATEFDHEGRGLREFCGCCVTTMSVQVLAFVCISSKDKVPVSKTLPNTSG